MTENQQLREVGFPDKQFIASGVDESNTEHLAHCWRTGDHEQAKEVISYLASDVRDTAEEIYESCKGVEPR